jgi:hypothetical protein
MATEVIFPTGRVIGGDLYKLVEKTDQNNQPVLKNGVPIKQVSFGVAIRKGAERGWWETEWGQKVYAVGSAAFPQLCGNPTFAWKISDGDSTIPNKRGKINASNENLRGCWVVWFRQGWPPKIVNADGTVELPTPDLVKPGYYVAVMADVQGNNQPNNAGVYLNPKAVAFRGEGPVITASVDTTGFGATAAMPLPPGATPPQAAAPGFAGAPPAPGMAPPAPAAPAPYTAPPAPGAPPAPVAPAQAAPAAPAAPPSPAFIQVAPGAPAAPVTPPAPAAPAAAAGTPSQLYPGHMVYMNPSAAGASFQQMTAGGWTEKTMLDAGHIRYQP